LKESSLRFIAPWTRIERVAYPIGDGFPDGNPIGNPMNIPHSWVGRSILFFERKATTVPNLYRRIFGMSEGVMWDYTLPITILQLKKIKSNKIFNTNLLYLLTPNTLSMILTPSNYYFVSRANIAL